MKLDDNYRLDKALTVQLMVRKESDEDNFNKIARVTNVLKQDNKKEILAKEIIQMDREFINRISDLEEDELTIQLDEYIDIVENNKPVRVNLEENNIIDLFSKDIDLDSFINQLWS